MPQISPMNWMLIFTFFIYLMLYIYKKALNEKIILKEKKMLK